MRLPRAQGRPPPHAGVHPTVTSCPRKPEWWTQIIRRKTVSVEPFKISNPTASVALSARALQGVMDAAWLGAANEAVDAMEPGAAPPGPGQSVAEWNEEFPGAKEVRRGPRRRPVASCGAPAVVTGSESLKTLSIFRAPFVSSTEIY